MPKLNVRLALQYLLFAYYRDQYMANKATNGNDGLVWQHKGSGYYSECKKRLK